MTLAADLPRDPASPRPEKHDTIPIVFSGNPERNSRRSFLKKAITTMPGVPAILLINDISFGADPEEPSDQDDAAPETGSQEARCACSCACGCDCQCGAQCNCDCECSCECPCQCPCNCEEECSCNCVCDCPCSCQCECACLGLAPQVMASQSIDGSDNQSSDESIIFTAHDHAQGGDHDELDIGWPTEISKNNAEEFPRSALDVGVEAETEAQIGTGMSGEPGASVFTDVRTQTRDAVGPSVSDAAQYVGHTYE